MDQTKVFSFVEPSSVDKHTKYTLFYYMYFIYQLKKALWAVTSKLLYQEYLNSYYKKDINIYFLCNNSFFSLSNSHIIIIISAKNVWLIYVVKNLSINIILRK